jgi:hypothetical protein
MCILSCAYITLFVPPLWCMKRRHPIQQTVHILLVLLVSRLCCVSIFSPVCVQVIQFTQFTYSVRTNLVHLADIFPALPKMAAKARQASGRSTRRCPITHNFPTSGAVNFCATIYVELHQALKRGTYFHRTLVRSLPLNSAEVYKL